LKQLLALFIIGILFSACKKIDIFEKRVAIPQHKWQRGFVPTFNFDITKNDEKYFVYAIVRHHNNYPYQNIWLKINMKAKDTTYSFPVNIALTENNKNTSWAHAGMGDVYEQIKRIAPLQKPIGEYQFSIENIMSDDPLPHILNVGLRIERIKTQ
jgi:gliding motility-associated lipoprotein GldH